MTPTLALDFYQDDFVARYIYSDLEDADRLYRAYAGGYGLSNGDPADNHWQVEAGHAPWWIDSELRMAFLRPLSQITHMADIRLWPDSSPLQHLHSFAWLAILILVITRMYRDLLGPTLGARAALLFALDHTHAFSIGYITNRHALVSAIFGAISLTAHVRWRRDGDWRAAGLGFAAFIVALSAGELSVSTFGYFVAYSIALERGSLLQRGATLVPYLAIIVGWRVVYRGLGYGAQHCGVYIDPAGEPLRFLRALLERAPVLTTGQFFYPPADFSYLVDAEGQFYLTVFGWIFSIALLISFIPMLRINEWSRFWLLGTIVSLVPASSTYPHNRQLMFVSLGAMALLAHFWQYHADIDSKSLSPLSKAQALVGSLALLGHLFVSPLVTPLAACSIALAGKYHDQIDQLGDEIEGRDIVFITSPDYLSTRLAQLMRRVEHRPLPRRWRALSFGAQPIRVSRPDVRTIRIEYHGGVMQTELQQLYRDKQHPMHPGDRVSLEGMEVEVLGVTEDERVDDAAFHFEAPTDDPRFVYYYWGPHGFAPFELPAIGESLELDEIRLEL